MRTDAPTKVRPSTARVRSASVDGRPEKRASKPVSVRVAVRAVAAAGIVAVLAVALRAPGHSAKPDAAAPGAAPSVGALTSAQADAARQSTGIASASVPFDAGSGDTGSILLDVLPAAVGPTEVHLTVLDGKNGLEDIAGVQAVLTPAGQSGAEQSGAGQTIALDQLGAGHYVSRGTKLTASGRWDLTITLITQLGNYVTTRSTLTVA